MPLYISNWISLCLGLLVGIHLSNGSDVADDDALQVQFTVYQDQNNRTQFQQTTLFNGHVIFSCQKPTTAEICQELREQPRQDWVARAFIHKEVQDRDKQCEQECSDHFFWLWKVEETTAATGGVLQRLRGCIINSSGEFPFDKWGVDGDDFLNFDPEASKWTALSDKANHLATEWNSQNAMNGAYKKISKTLCNTVKSLKQVATTSNNTKQGPKLHIFAKPISGGTIKSLRCYVSYSDLSGLCIQLTEDGVPLGYEVNVTGPLPNGDGTVQMRLEVKTTLDSSRTYKCDFHSKTDNKSVVLGNPSPQKMSFIGAGVAIAAFVIFGFFLGLACSWQRRPDYSPVPTNSPGPPVVAVSYNGSFPLVQVSSYGCNSPVVPALTDGNNSPLVPASTDGSDLPVVPVSTNGSFPLVQVSSDGCNSPVVPALTDGNNSLLVPASTDGSDLPVVPVSTGDSDVPVVPVSLCCVYVGGGLTVEGRDVT